MYWTQLRPTVFASRVCDNGSLTETTKTMRAFHSLSYTPTPIHRLLLLLLLLPAPTNLVMAAKEKAKSESGIVVVW